MSERIAMHTVSTGGAESSKKFANFALSFTRARRKRSIIEDAHTHTSAQSVDHAAPAGGEGCIDDERITDHIVSFCAKQKERVGSTKN